MYVLTIRHLLIFINRKTIYNFVVTYKIFFVTYSETPVDKIRYHFLYVFDQQTPYASSLKRVLSARCTDYVKTFTDIRDTVCLRSGGRTCELVRDSINYL